MVTPKNISVVLIILFNSFSLLFAQKNNQNELRILLMENMNDLNYLVKQPNIDSLNQYYNSMPIHDVVSRIVYGSRMVKFGKNNNGSKILLEAIPTDKVQLFYFYELASNPSGNTCTDSLLSGILTNYIEILAKLIPSHRSYIQNYFCFGYLQDGEFTEAYASWCAWLMEQNCVWFFKELSKSNPLVEERILDIVVNLGQPSINCLKIHNSQIPNKYLRAFNLSK